MSTTAKTRRQLEHAEALAARNESERVRRIHAAQRSAEQGRIDELTAKRTSMQEALERRVDRYFAIGQEDPGIQVMWQELDTIAREIEHHTALRDRADARLQELSVAAGPIHTAHAAAVAALAREPSEDAINGILEGLKAVEERWEAAGVICKTLEQSGDQWGRNMLTRLLHQITAGRTGYDSPFQIHFPTAIDQL